MHILTLTNNWRYFIQHRFHVVQRARSQGYATTVMGPENEVPETLFNIGLKIKIAPIVGRIAPLCDFRALVIMWRVIRLKSVSLVHAITLKPIILALLFVHLWGMTRQKRSLSVVVTFPGLGYIFAPKSRMNLKGWLRYWLVAIFLWIFLRGRNVWATFETQEDLNSIQAVVTLDPDHMILISGTGVDLAMFHPGEDPDRQRFSVLFAGRLLRSKGILEFVKAAKNLAPHGIEFEVAGWEYDSPDGLELEEINAMMESDSLIYHGFVDRMPELLRSVNAVVLPSSYPEGIPKIFLEAAASCLPIISTDFPGARRVIKDGVTGIIIKAPTVEQIQAAILAIYHNADRGKAMGDKARCLIESGHFSEADIQKQFLDVFEKAHNSQNRV